MKSETLSHRQRVQLALHHEVADRVPIATVCGGLQPPVHKALEAHLRAERELSVEAYLRPLVDILRIDPPYIGPPLGANEDIWSVVRKPVSYGAGCYMEIDHYPLAAARTIDDAAAHRWPSPEWFDYDAMPAMVAEINAGGEYCLMSQGGNPFEKTWYMRGFEDTLADMVLDPDLIEFVMRKVTDFFVAHSSRILEAVGDSIDLMFTADDIGGQSGLLMSLDLWRERIKPHHARLNRSIHGHDAKVIYHTDGGVMEAVDELIDMGVDVLQALQFDAEGMDPRRLGDEFGDRLCFEGGVSVQHTLPFGTADDVRDEVRLLIDTLGRGGGYILGPAHAVQAGTPPENVAAMFDEAASIRPRR